MAYNPQNANGQATMAASAPVVIASNQTAIPVSGTFYQATQPVSGTITANLSSSATGGDTTFHLVSAANTNPTNIKASQGVVTGWYMYNSSANARKVAFHNVSGSPTAGSSVFYSIVIPGLAATNVSFPNGLAFSTGIAITTVTGLADSDNNSVALNDLVINIFYK